MTSSFYNMCWMAIYILFLFLYFCLSHLSNQWQMVCHPGTLWKQLVLSALTNGTWPGLSAHLTICGLHSYARRSTGNGISSSQLLTVCTFEPDICRSKVAGSMWDPRMTWRSCRYDGERGCKNLLFEVSSHALASSRCWRPSWWFLLLWQRWNM